MSDRSRPPLSGSEMPSGGPAGGSTSGNAPGIPRLPGSPGDSPEIRPSGAFAATGLDTYVQNQLFERRIVLAQGALDRERATSVSAQLLTLEALDNSPIQLRMACSGGELDAVLGLVDTIGMLGVELTAVAVGEVSGAAVAAFAAASRRHAHPHARFGLHEPEAPTAEGSATRIGALAHDYLARHQAFLDVIARATGRQAEAIEADVRTGRFLTAEQAVGYGLVSERPLRR